MTPTRTRRTRAWQESEGSWSVDLLGPEGAILQFTVERDGAVHFWGFDIDGRIFQMWGSDAPELPSDSALATRVRRLTDNAR